MKRYLFNFSLYLFLILMFCAKGPLWKVWIHTCTNIQLITLFKCVSTCIFVCVWVYVKTEKEYNDQRLKNLLKARKDMLDMFSFKSAMITTGFVGNRVFCPTKSCQSGNIELITNCKLKITKEILYYKVIFYISIFGGILTIWTLILLISC